MKYIIGGLMGIITSLIFIVWLGQAYPHLKILWFICFVGIWAIIMPLINKYFSKKK